VEFGIFNADLLPSDSSLTPLNRVTVIVMDKSCLLR
jgi:hypothetical protein